MKKFLFSLFASLALIPVFATTYYSQGNVAFNTLGNWDTNRPGGGTGPANFTTSGDIFIIQGLGGGGAANHAMSLGNTLSIGAGVKVQVESGGSLTCTSQ